MILLPVHKYKQPLFRGRRGPLALLLFALAAVVPAFGYASTNPVARTDFQQPDVLVLVMGMGAFDQCAINYTTAVPLKTAQADLDAIAALGKWRVSDARSETKSSGGPNPKPTTSTTWRAEHVINYSDGTLALEPFVTALKRFKLIRVLYILPANFQFRGLREFSNDYVDIVFRPGENSYNVFVKNNDFSKLDLPLTQPAEPKPRDSARMSTGARAGLAFGIGIPAAVMAYLIALHFSKRR